MKKQHSILLLVFFILGCSNSEHWNEITVEDKNCKILLPSNSYKSSNNIYHGEGIGKILSYEIDLNTQSNDDPNIGYKFTCYEYPEFDFDMADKNIDLFYKGTIENILIAFNGDRIYEKEIKFEGYSGRELYFVMKDKEIYFTIRSYIIDNKQYMLTVITKKDNLFNHSINKYMNSFKLTK